MKKPKKLLQAYQQAPWRVQLQWLGFFLLGVVLIATVAGMYLNLSGRAAAAGRSIQAQQRQITTLKREINDLSTKLAYISSAGQIKARLKGTDMQVLDPEQALYIEVEGYQSKDTVVLAPPVETGNIPSPVIQPEYTASLWEWFVKNVWSASEKPSISEERVNP